MFLDLNNSIPTLYANMTGALALALLSYFIGIGIRNCWPLLKTLSMPPPVIGGLFFASVATLFHELKILDIQIDPQLQRMSMIAFMCSIGLMGSIKRIRHGGLLLIAFLFLSNVLGILQNFLGMLLAYLFNLNPHYGILAGSVSLMGGIGTGAAFGPFFEETYGVTGATGVAVTSGTFGIVMALLFGAPFGEYLVRRYHLHSLQESIRESGCSLNQEDNTNATSSELLKIMALVVFSMVIGELINELIEGHIHFPVYLMPMVVAITLRNIGDVTKIVNLNNKALSCFSNVTLILYVSMAINSLKLYELSHLAIPLTVILILQTIVSLLFSWIFIFKLMGKNYQSMMLAVGQFGFSVGITANGLTNMQTLGEKYGTSPQAIFIVSIVGTFLIDITNAFVVTWMATWF